jgi:DNA polymerase-3 subunit delta
MEILRKQLKENNIGRLFLFTGPEQFLVRHYVNEILHKLLDEDTKAFNFSELEGKVSPQTLDDAVSQFPAFAERRVVIVKESTLLKQSTKAMDWNTFFKGLPEFICLIFIQGEVDKRFSFYKALKNHGLVVECSRQDERSLTRWVMRGFASFHKQIDEQDAAYLVSLLEPDMTFMALEIEKIARYVGEGARVTREAIQSIASKSVKSRIFDLTDAISQRQIPQALQILNDLLELKEPISYIMAMVGRQMGILLRIKKMEEKKVPQADMAKVTGIHPYVVGKARRQAASFSMDMLKHYMRKCMEMDLASKTGRMDPRTALDLFIIEMGNR